MTQKGQSETPPSRNYCSGLHGHLQSRRNDLQHKHTMGQAFSHIDRIFVWSHSHSKITETAVEYPSITHTHMRTKTGGTHPSPTTALSTHQEPQAKLPTHKKQIQTRHTTKETKAQFSLQIHEALQTAGPNLIQRIKNWKHDRESEKAMQEFTTTVKRIAGNRLAPPETNTGNIICKNERQESDCETWQKSQDNLKRYRTSTEQLQEPENTPRFNKLLARLPGHIHSTKAPLKRQDKQWVAMIRWERRAHSSNYAHTEQSKSATTE
jgi:hypothetical protein